MTLYRGIVLITVFLAALALPPPVLAQDQPEEAMVRVAHLSADAPNVDVYVNDEPVDSLTNLPFATVSSHTPLPSGVTNVKIFAAGDTSEPLLEADLDFRGKNFYTLGIIGEEEDGSLEVRVYEADESPPAKGRTEIRAVYAVMDVGPATLSTGDGRELFTIPGFSNMSRYTDIRAGDYDLYLSPAGSDEPALSVVPNTTLEAGEQYTLFILGSPDDGSLGAILTADSGTGTTVNTVGAAGNTDNPAGGSTNDASGGSTSGQYADEAQYGASTAPRGEYLADTGGSSPLALLPAAHAVLVLAAAIGLLAQWWRGSRGA